MNKQELKEAWRQSPEMFLERKQCETEGERIALRAGFDRGFDAGYSANAKLIEDVIEFLSRKLAKDTLPYGGGASGEGIIASAPVSEIDSLIYRLRKAIEPESGQELSVTTLVANEQQC